jgi:hypothetical protein
MNLSFREKINGKPTYFVEKIWTAFNLGIGGYQLDFGVRGWWITDCALNNAIQRNLLAEVGIKIHTIRADPKNRWKVGSLIHFVIRNRTPQRFQFAPVLPVKAIQSVKILWYRGKPLVWIDHNCFYNQLIGIDNGILALANNDGFDTVEDFFTYFNEDFNGKIIHWTEHIY